MQDYQSFDVVTRYGGNPILTGRDFPAEYRIQHCFNSGVIRFRGRYLMMCRLENMALRPSFWIADSDDGYHFTPRKSPVPLPFDNPEFREYTAATFYDPRITEIGDTYHIVHAAHSSHGCRLSLLETNDFEQFTWRGFISETDNRNGVLFPEKFNGLYCRLDRPNTGDSFGDMWVSYSPDLIHWGQSCCVLRNREVTQWAYAKIGPGAVPIKTPEGWLNIFHGVRTLCKYHHLYSLGVCLHPLNDPSRIIARYEGAILTPQTPYELNGQTPSVVFTCGAIAEPDGEVKIYYGGADAVMCVATTSITRLLDACFNRGTFANCHRL